jgi:pyruvate dehydrogenase E1 component
VAVDRENGGDIDPEETREWTEAVDAVVAADGPDRAAHLLTEAVNAAHREGAAIQTSGPTPYVNTIDPEEEPEPPGDPELERRVRSLVRWNAIATILRANAESSELGGHIASYQSAAVLYEIGFNHFWHAPTHDHDGDLVYIQGHSSPGIYARSFLEGRLSEEQMLGFRQEVSTEGGLSSYPHPWLMPDYWQFPTVSMGLGPIMAIHQAYFMRYLSDRGLRRRSARSRSPGARGSTTSSSSSTAICSVSTVPSSATERSSSSWRPCSAGRGGT